MKSPSLRIPTKSISTPAKSTPLMQRKTKIVKKRKVTRKLFASSTTQNQSNESSNALFEWMEQIQQENMANFEKKYGFTIITEKPVSSPHDRYVWTPMVRLEQKTLTVANN